MAGPLAAAIKMGPGVYTLGANTYYTDGSIEAGMNADISKGRPSSLSLAVALAITERSPFIKATIVEPNATSAADFWDCTAATWGLPADKTPTSVASTAVCGGTTYTITTGFVSEYGSVTMSDGEMQGVGVTVEGYSSDGATAAGSIVTPI